MTAITYGGGPTLQQKRDFSGLKDGAHIPGYQGYCPQIKYRQGKTFGEDTHDLAKDLSYYSGPRSLTFSADVSTAGASSALYSDEVQTKKLPKPTGDNKYTERMVPGYTGYVPKRLYNFGATYRATCDDCVDEFVRDYERGVAASADIKRAAGLFPRLQPTAGDPGVRDHMNFWADNKSRHPLLLEDKRGSLEPPIPGYKGFVPRAFTTDVGLGKRYRNMTGDSLAQFRAEQCQVAAQLGLPQPQHRSGGLQAGAGAGVGGTLLEGADGTGGDIMATGTTAAKYSRRVFPQSGLIPRYTGYVPKQKYAIGHTYGDTSRSLSICNHEFPSYGEYKRSLTAVQ